MHILANTPVIDWRRLREAFGAAIKILSDPEMPQSGPVYLPMPDGTVEPYTVADLPYTRVLFAAKSWFPDPVEMAAAGDRIYSLIAVLEQLPFDLVAIDGAPDDDILLPAYIREEVFMVAAEVKLNRNGKIPRGRMQRLLEERIERSRSH